MFKVYADGISLRIRFCHPFSHCFFVWTR